MADLKKKMEAAKERIAKMKTLANSHKALADKKEAHIAKRAANPMEERFESAAITFTTKRSHSLVLAFFLWYAVRLRASKPARSTKTVRSPRSALLNLEVR